MNQYKKNVHSLTNIVYAIGCFALYFVAALIIGFAIVGVAREFFKEDFTIYKMLDEIGLIIFGIAVIDIARYLLDEEVFRSAEDRSIGDMKRTLTKIISIISTALFLKGLILTMETSHADLKKVYDSLFILLSPVPLLIGLGIYNFLSRTKNET